MADLYSPPTGFTPAATQTQSLADVIGSLGKISGASPQAVQALQGYQTASNQAATMQANEPNFSTQDQKQQMQGAQLPEAGQTYGNIADMYKMFIADHQLSQQFTNPNFQPGQTPNGATVNPTAPTYGAVGAPQMPMMTPQNVNAPFAGFTDPGLATQAEGLTGQGIMDVLNNLSSLINTNYSRAQKGYTSDMGNYNAMISGAQTNAGQFLQALSLLSGGALGSVGGVSTNPQVAEQQIQTDVKNGMTLEDAILKYRSVTDPNSIYGIYNTIHATDAKGAKGSKGWGTAKQTAEQLAQMGITGAPLTQLNKSGANGKSLQKTKLSDGSLGSYDKNTGKYYDALGNDVSKVEANSIVTADQAIIDSAKKMKEQLLKVNVALRTGPLANVTKHFSPELTGAQAQLMQQIGTLKKAIGGRVTQQELFKWLDAEFPSGADFSPEVMDSKISSLQDKLNADIKAHGGSVSGGGSGGTQTKGNDPLGIL